MYLVFDVGGTFIKYAWMTSDGEILDKGKEKTPGSLDHSAEDFVETLGGIYDQYKDRDDFQGIAIDLPGQIDVENGIVYGGGALRYMHKVPLVKLMEERCDGHRVSIENDAKAAALAEVWKGNASDVQDACVLIFGTGIGGALIKDRKVHRGKHLLAGEMSFAIETMTREEAANIQSIEGMDVMEAVDKVPYFWAAHGATGAVCHKLAKKKGLLDSEVTGEKMYAWAKDGDAEAAEALEDMYFCIAKRCLSLFVTYDPEVILIGGGISAEPEFFAGINRYVEKIKELSLIYDKIRLDVCRYRNDSNLLGALYNFKQIYEMEL